MKIQREQGFTLIELMIVIAIIGILAAIAVPQFQNYTGRAQVSEAISVMSGLKTPITEACNATGKPPTQVAGNELVGDLTGFKYVQNVTYATDGSAEATLTATMTQDVVELVKGKKVTLITGNCGKKWACGGDGTDVASKFRPSSCQGGDTGKAKAPPKSP